MQPSSFSLCPLHYGQSPISGIGKMAEKSRVVLTITGLLWTISEPSKCLLLGAFRVPFPGRVRPSFPSQEESQEMLHIKHVFMVVNIPKEQTLRDLFKTVSLDGKVNLSWPNPIHFQARIKSRFLSLSQPGKCPAKFTCFAHVPGQESMRVTPQAWVRKSVEKSS